MPSDAQKVAEGLEWLDPATAPLDGREILILLGETIPDHADARAATFIDGDAALELGYREYARFGAWMIWHDSGDDWWCVDVTTPLGWLPLPVKMPLRHRVIDGLQVRQMLQQKEPHQ